MLQPIFVQNFRRSIWVWLSGTMAKPAVRSGRRPADAASAARGPSGGPALRGRVPAVAGSRRHR